MDLVDSLLRDVSARSDRLKRPVTTLSYAQSLDGSITTRRGEPAEISAAESLRLVHRLRAAHDAILVGVGTVLADNPRLTVRLAQGKNPQPVVLDHRLRMPPDCALAQRGDLPVWVLCGAEAPIECEQRLTACGVRVARLPEGPDGLPDLRAALEWLFVQGVRSLMVEGGARVLHSFLRRGLADQAVVTVAPFWMGGLNLFEAEETGLRPRLIDPHWEQYGPDGVVWGRIDLTEAEKSR